MTRRLPLVILGARLPILDTCCAYNLIHARHDNREAICTYFVDYLSIVLNPFADFAEKIDVVASVGIVNDGPEFSQDRTARKILPGIYLHKVGRWGCCTPLTLI